MIQKIRKALFPVAGLGTRFLPITKAIAKEMLPVVDKPLIQYAVEEAINAGITDLIFVTGRTKRSIADHFDKAYELENELQKHNKNSLLEIVQNIPPGHINCMHIRQPEPLGLGHAVLCGRAAIGNEPFAVLLADDLIDDGERGCLKQMMDVFEQHQGSIVAVTDIPREESQKYGIISSAEIDRQLSKLDGILEKPLPSDAPSTKAVVGRYILTPTIFELLTKIDVDDHGEIQLTDAIAALLGQEQVYGYAFQGKRYDCGTKIGYLQAVVEYALKHPEIKYPFADYLANR